MARRLGQSSAKSPVGGSNSASNTRVKVAVRCRPAFQDEIDFANGEFFSIVDVKKDAVQQNNQQLGQLALTTISGKQRDFYFDYVFGDDVTQDFVYDKLARPVVTEVLKGCNGTIFAYGQTGTGKTYTMGILEFIHNEHAGLIPRTIFQIFEHVQGRQQQQPDDVITVSMSFLQLYRENIQDLLAPAAATGGAEENLAIREDPIRGFYVEGLQEFAVRNYREAEALINLGLENRAIAPTLMNSTSSRSHTVLTINIEQRLSGNGSTSFAKTLRSKLLMVDLAGSERVQRTSSKGTRLSEAKSINTSLSALGNVIAALAEPNSSHVPYRDSKLTRLLQDSLGGNAATALIATIGPAAINYGETLSTLLFAQRCMAVKITPIPHEEIDYAEMCAKLQSQLNAMEGKMTEKLLEQQMMYEQTIQNLNKELEEERQHAQQNEFLNAVHGGGGAGGNGVGGMLSTSDFNEELQMVLDYVHRLASIGEGSEQDSNELQESWLRKPFGWTPNGKKLQSPNGQLISVISYSFELIKYLSLELNKLLKANLDREEKMKEQLVNEFQEEHELEKDREWEREHMFLYDPRNQKKDSTGDGGEGDNEGEKLSFGNHLASLSKVDAMRRVEGQHRSNNAPVGTWDRQSIQPNPAVTSAGDTGAGGWKVEDDPQTNQRMTSLNDYYEIPLLPSVYNYQSLEELVVALTTVHKHLQQSLASVNTVLVRKDLHYKTIKQELTIQLVEKRQREEEVVNWSFILKYLLASSTKLRKQLQVERSRNSNGNVNSVIRGTIVNGNNGSNGTSGKKMPQPSMPQQHQPVFVPVLGSAQQQRQVQQMQQQRMMQENSRDFDESASIASEAPPPPPLSINLPTPRMQSQPQMMPASSMSSASTGIQPSPMERLFNSNQESHTPFVNENTGMNSRPTSASHSHRSQGQSRQSSVGQGQRPDEGQQNRYEDDYNEYDDEEEEDPYQNGGGYDYDSEYSLTSTTRSFRSAATPNSIPLPHYRKSTRSKGSNNNMNNIPQQMQQQQTPHISSTASQSSTGSGTRVVQRTAMKDIRNSNPRSRNGSRSSSPNLQQQQQQPPGFQQYPPQQQQQMQAMHGQGQQSMPFQGRSAGTAPPSAGANRGPIGIADHSGKKKSAVPSSFAQEVVKSLGVQGEQAIAAMSVIDRVSSISPEQLAALDEETRQQILQIRKDLGIDHLFDASGRRAVNVSTIPGFVTADQRKQQAELNHIQRTSGNGRAMSAPRSRSSTIDTGASSARPRSLTPTTGPRSPMQQNASPGGSGGRGRGSNGYLSDSYSQASHQSRVSMPMSAITQSSFGTNATGNNNNRMMMPQGPPQQQMRQQQPPSMQSPLPQDYRHYQNSMDDRSPLTTTTTYSEHEQAAYQPQYQQGRQFRPMGGNAPPPQGRSVSPAASIGSHGSGNRWANFASNNPSNMNPAQSQMANGRSMSPQRLPPQQFQRQMMPQGYQPGQPPAQVYHQQSQPQRGQPQSRNVPAEYDDDDDNYSQLDFAD